MRQKGLEMETRLVTFLVFYDVNIYIYIFKNIFEIIQGVVPTKTSRLLFTMEGF